MVALVFAVRDSTMCVWTKNSGQRRRRSGRRDRRRQIVSKTLEDVDTSGQTAFNAVFHSCLSNLRRSCAGLSLLRNSTPRRTLGVPSSSTSSPKGLARVAVSPTNTVFAPHERKVSSALYDRPSTHQFCGALSWFHVVVMSLNHLDRCAHLIGKQKNIDFAVYDLKRRVRMSQAIQSAISLRVWVDQ